jgi:hypothetical protein
MINWSKKFQPKFEVFGLLATEPHEMRGQLQGIVQVV